jgi:hypothetical protein
VTDKTSPPDPAPQPECWCVYGTRSGGIAAYGIEVQTPGCPAHDPTGTPDPEPILDELHDSYDDEDGDEDYYFE